ncbi:MAG: hypothetical protein KKH41_08880 [Candidatus Thermoplasmatota archaeon]|nr:hypothetical protein [Candidatus Thermoplasmatota archaeon]MBU4592679.1 hypothetical protein [Candidatus Thermoplasmatota archaeon]
MGYPYYGPGWTPVRDCETRKGLNHFLKAMYLALILMLVSGLVLGVVLSSMTGFEGIEDETDVMGMMGTLAVLAISGIIVLVAGIAAFILFVMGLMEIHRGKSEFGPAHEGSVKLAIIFLILSIVISLVGGGVAVALTLGTVDLANQNPNAFGVQDTFNGINIITGIIGVVSAIFQYLFFVYLVKEISKPERRTTLWAGFGLGVGNSIVSLLIIIMIFNGWLLNSANDFELALYTSLIPTVMSVIAIIIFIVCFREVVSRIDSGELKPLPPQMPYYPGYQGMPPPPPPPPPNYQ